MAKPTGFMEYKRQEVGYRDIHKRINDFDEINIPLTPDDLKKQAARCMDCGTPFCHGSGCPLGNLIPEFNDCVYNGRWKQACDILHSTNNFPEITGRVCPAPCESACTLGINEKPVLIRHIEFQIVERGFEQGWIKPLQSKIKTGKRIAVIGSGPAGLAAAQQLARMGHNVAVFEKDEKIGGLMRYGIPDFKLNKAVIDRRLEQLAAEGVSFQTGVNVGQDISARYLQRMFDAVCITMGAGQPRDLNVTGRGYENIHFAMDFLKEQNKICSGENQGEPAISARGKNVVVIGGGDTGSDCVGTSIRQGAKQVYQFEILPKPPEARPIDTPWPQWPRIMRTSSSHQEGCQRQWSVMTKKFSGLETQVNQVHCSSVEWCKDDNGKWKLQEVEGSDFTINADLVLLAMGFLHITHNELIKELDLKLDANGNVIANNYQTSQPWVFSAGDSVSGASLVVRAIDSGRKAARAIDNWLKKND